MKLNSLTNSPAKPQPKPAKLKKVKKKSKASNKTNYIPATPFSIDVEVSKNYEGLSDNILGIINSLNPVIKSFFQNALLKSTKVSSGTAEYSFEDNLYLRVTDCRLAGKNCKKVVIKQGKKEIFNNFVKTTQWT